MANGLSPKFSTKLPTKIQTGLGTSATVYSSPSNTSPNNLGRKLPEGSYYSLEEAFAGFHVKNGFSRANRYEVLLNPPSGGNTAFAQVLRNYVGDGTVRQTGLRCEQISFICGNRAHREYTRNLRSCCRNNNRPRNQDLHKKRSLCF